MKNWKIFIIFISLLTLILGDFLSVDAQQNLAQQAYAIFEQSCLNCHGEHGAFTEEIIIDHTALIETGAVVPGKPIESELYKRLLAEDEAKRMPLGQPRLSGAAIVTIENWIQAGAPNWEDTSETDGVFITPKAMLETIEKHVNSLAPFDRPFARYFTLTHLYNAGERTETLRAYRQALSKLVNSLSWGRKVINPRSIDPKGTIFYIDLRDYEWEIGTNRWTLIEAEYPYEIEFNAPTQTSLREKLTNLRETMACEVPFIHVDWFLATASLPPLYHDILGLPETDRELETRLEVNVVENIRNAPGKRVWRAGFNDSGVSNHNRVVERHDSRYGAYWKSYDFAGSIGTQNIFTHPLSFEHDGGEIIFNLPNGLQAYYLADAGGRRLDEAPIDIVSNPAASDPTVRNGLSCIGCHTEGMKDFEDTVRGVIQRNANPPFNKARALQLYTDKATMNRLVSEDTTRYRKALEATGGVFGGIEPVQRFHEAFQRPLDAAHAAAAVGLETETFLQRIRQNVGLKNLGLLVLETGTIKRDTWTNQFSEIVFALDFRAKSVVTPVDPQTERIPGESVHFPDPNLRAAVANALGKAPGTPITAEEMATLKEIETSNGIHDLTGLEFAVNLRKLGVTNGSISDLSPIAGLTQLLNLVFEKNKVSDISPVAGLKNLEVLGFNSNLVSDISPVVGLKNLTYLAFAHNRASDLPSLARLKNLQVIHLSDNNISDLSPLSGLSNLRRFRSWTNPLSDLSTLVGLKTLEIIDICGGTPDISTLTGAINLRELYLIRCGVSDVSPLAGLTGLERLSLEENSVSDVSALRALTHLKWLDLKKNKVSDVSALGVLTNLKWLNLKENKISDVSPLTELTKLGWLNLEENAISDFSPLGGLPETTSIFRLFNPANTLKPGPKIEGPWLWVIIPTGDMGGTDAAASGIDFLAEVSGGVITELKVATKGAMEGNPVGDSAWVSHKIATERWNNINHMANDTGLGTGDINHHVAYGVVLLSSPREQNTEMFVGGDDAVKVWLNGELVHNNPVEGRSDDYRDVVPVTLRQASNVLLVAVYEDKSAWHGFFGFKEGTEYTVSANSGVGYAFSESIIHQGDIFTLDISAKEVHDLAGWQFDIAYDSAMLEAVEVNEGDFLKTGGGATFFQKGRINNATGKITKLSSARLAEDGVRGSGTLLSVTFTAKTAGQTQLRLENFQFATINGVSISAGPYEVGITIEKDLATGDVNRDGQVSILDMVLVARHLGKTIPAHSDVDLNGDGVVNILDLILVSQNMGKSTAAASPSILTMDDIDGLDPAMIQAWIEQAQVEDDGSIAFQQGIANLQRLLASLIPEETALLPNYPNPFNPETWIPYHLANSSEVQITIYDTRGTVVRRLDLGHQREGYYTSPGRAAYWDGRNAIGERVASGIYFYQLQADHLSFLRRMVILK